MKRFLLLLMACATMFASCQKDADLSTGADGGMVDVTVSATMEGASATTRAITDGYTYGDGQTVDRCIMEVYCDNVLYKRMVTSTISTETDGTRDVTFELRLVASSTKKYDFLFWADDSDGMTANTEESSADNSAGATYDNYYDTDSTDGLKGITASYDNYKGNDESRDAFFANKLGVTIESSVVLNDIYLTRPFGQLNVLTYLTDVPTTMYPQYVQISSSTPLADTFNVYSGETSTSSDATGNNFKWSLSEAAIDDSVDETTKLMHLSTDYIFAPYYAEGEAVKQQLVDFSMSFYKDDTASYIINTNDNFKNIPIQRNYRTNVSGELLTKEGTINVTIDPAFDNNNDNVVDDDIIDVYVKDVATLDALNTEMIKDSGKTNAAYSVADEVDGDTTKATVYSASITIPNLTDPALSTTELTSRSFNLLGGIDENTTLTVEYTTTDSSSTNIYPDVVSIIVPSETTSGDLTINLPYSTVYLSGTFNSVTSKTASTTLIINEDATIVGTLTIEKGNVELYGTLESTSEVVKAVGNTEDTTITIYPGAVVENTESISAEITQLTSDPTQPIQNVTSGISYSATQFQDAIDAATDGDVIELAAGVYEETNIKINKTLTIKGAQAGVSALSSTRDIDETTNETVFTGNFSSVGATGKTVVVDGVYFLGGSEYTATNTYNFTVVSTDKVEVTNCMAKDIDRYLIYNNATSSLINELVITNNKFFGDYDGSTASSGDDLLIYVNMVKSLTVTGNYLSSSSRGVNIAVTATHDDGYNSETTQATITNNTFTNMKNYGVQTSYYPYGKIVINNNTFSDIDGGTDGEEEGAINIRGYQPSGGDGKLEYEYEITNNTFTNVASVFLPRLYSETDGSGLEIGDDKIVIKDNTISSFTNWILRCDGKDYNGTIDLSDNDITYTGSFASYLYLLGDAKVLYGGVEYEYVFPAYNETQKISYTSLSAAITAAADNDVIQLAAGTFSEAITVDKPLTIKGAQAGVSGLSADRGDTSKESVMTNVTRMGAEINGTVTLDGLYFPKNEGTTTTYKIYVNIIDKFVVTNSIADGIEGNFVYCDEQSKYKGEVEVTNNKIVGSEVAKSGNTHIFVYNTNKMTITNNYMSTTSRAINLAISAEVGYSSEHTQATIENNTFYDLSNYAIQTSYYSYGKIVINNNSFEKICSQDGTNTDGSFKDNSTEDGAINIRGYQTADQTTNNELKYEYDITYNTFKDVQNLFFIRTYNNGSSGDALNIPDVDQVNIANNSITVNTTSGSDYETDWLFRCDKTGYIGTIDLSTNTITGFPSGKSFENYLYLTTDAKVTYGGETHPNNTIVSASELQAFALSVNAGNTYAGETITLDSDLDLSSIADWTPIGDGTRSGSGFSGNSFQGTFDGNNKTIKNLQITSTTAAKAAVGLFGVVSNGTVKNLIFEDVNINVSDSELAAAAVGMLTGSSALVDNVDVKSGSVSAENGNGAIVGRMTVSGTISNCENSATITGTSENVGGIIGAAYYTEADKNMYITNCNNYGTVTNSTKGVTGGIAGLSAAHVSGCTNTAAITGNGYSIGGIVAEQKCYGSVKSCTNSGNITNNTDTYGTGGIVGWVRYNDTTTNYANYGVIEVSTNKNSGVIDGGSDAGGIVGTCYHNGIINSNTNTAATISSSKFAAGIVGNAQFITTESTILEIEYSIELKNNVSTTTIDNIIATGDTKCTDLYVYDNSTGAYVTTDGNTNTIE